MEEVQLQARMITRGLNTRSCVKGRSPRRSGHPANPSTSGTATDWAFSSGGKEGCPSFPRLRAMKPRPMTACLPPKEGRRSLRGCSQVAGHRHLTCLFTRIIQLISVQSGTGVFRGGWPRSFMLQTYRSLHPAPATHSCSFWDRNHRGTMAL